MTDSYSDQTRALLNLLSKLPAKPQITFRGYVDRAMDRVRVVSLPTLAATIHSLEIATNSPVRSGVAVVVDADGRDPTPILRGAPNFDLQEIAYLPNSYFLQHVAHECNGVTIQVYEEIVLSNQSADFTITHPLRTWNPVLAVFDPVSRATWECSLPAPRGSSDRFLEPIHRCPVHSVRPPLTGG